MLDCARKGGSTAAVRAIQKQLEGQGSNTSNGNESEVERTRSRTDDDRGRGQDARAQPNPAQSPNMSTEVQRQRHDELKPEDSSDFDDDPGSSHMNLSPRASAGSAAAKFMEPDAILVHQPRGDARRQPRRY